MWHSRLRKWLLANSHVVVGIAQDMAFPFAWCLVTWSFVGWDPKYWARSIGFMLFTYVVASFATAYYATKARDRHDVDRRR